MKCNEFKNEIDTLEFEVSNQELAGKSGSGGWYTAFKLTLAGRCGLCFTCSYECTSNNVHCQKLNIDFPLFIIDNIEQKLYIKRGKEMRKENHGIDTLDYEISHQELGGKSAAGLHTAFILTFHGHCGGVFTLSYECSTPHVSCG